MSDRHSAGALLAVLLCTCVAETTAPCDQSSQPSVDPRAVLLISPSGVRCSAAVVVPHEAFTAAHCVDGAETAEIVFDRDDSVHAAVALRRPADVDFAVLHLPERAVTAALPVATVAPTPGDALTLLGFGCADRREARALISAGPGVADGCACYGDSGAPIVNARGELVGIFVGWAANGQPVFDAILRQP